MQELEKILEEIEEGTHTFELLGRDVDFVAIDWVRDVIRKYMNDDIEIIEPCPHCANEVVLHWDVEKDGYEVYCPYCGFPMMLCSMCDARDGSVCDWEEIKGCKHSGERYRDYFRKHMNDGWIPVEERMPEEKANPELQDFYEYQVTAKFGEVTDVRHYKFGNGHWWNGPGIVDKYVIAWRERPYPYHPERSEGE